MGLAAVFDEFKAALPQEVDYLGPGEHGAEEAPPRITWEPFAARHAPPKRVTGGPRDQGEIWQRELTVHVRIWGRTHEEAEQLLVVFANAVHDKLSHHGYQLGGEQWSIGGPASQGFEVLLSVVVGIPLPRLPRPSVPLSDINATFKLNQTTV